MLVLVGSYVLIMFPPQPKSDKHRPCAVINTSAAFSLTCVLLLGVHRQYGAL